MLLKLVFYFKNEVIMKFKNLFDLTNRVALVTGGLGILGKRFCCGLAEYGAKVAVVDIDQEKSSDFAKELTECFSIQSLGIHSLFMPFL